MSAVVFTLEWQMPLQRDWHCHFPALLHSSVFICGQLVEMYCMHSYEPEILQQAGLIRALGREGWERQAGLMKPFCVTLLLNASN